MLVFLPHIEWWPNFFFQHSHWVGLQILSSLKIKIKITFQFDQFSHNLGFLLCCYICDSIIKSLSYKLQNCMSWTYEYILYNELSNTKNDDKLVWARPLSSSFNLVKCKQICKDKAKSSMVVNVDKCVQIRPNKL